MEVPQGIIKFSRPFSGYMKREETLKIRFRIYWANYGSDEARLHQKLFKHEWFPLLAFVFWDMIILVGGTGIEPATYAL